MNPSPPSLSSPKPVSVRAGKRVDGILIALTVSFAFLAASFTATNSDLWLHLAAGRLIGTGGYTFGVDPFSYNTGGIYWANHAWCFDWMLYTVFHTGGGTAIVVVKALGVAALAGTMLRLSLRSAGPVWLASGATLLAILALSPRLLVQPQCLSLLLLAICLSLLQTGGRALRLLPVLCALWVNLDGWFLLGPALAAMFVIGERLGSDTTSPKLPRWLLPVCLLACMLSPHHVQAFALPPELSPAVWRSEFPNDRRFDAFFAHPWRLASFGRAGGYSLAAWAFPMLVAGGLLSFALNRRAVRSWRLVVWLPFALLAAWQVRLVPFFAVVAGPILALNLGEVVAAGRYLRAGRMASAFAAVALLVLAWPGWLQGFYARDRAIAWDIAPDPSFVQAAQSLREYRERNALPAEARVFATHADAANHLAWFAPGEKSFLDSRLHLFTAVAAENRAVGIMLGLVPDRDGPDRGERVLRDRGVGLIVISDSDRQMLGSALKTISENPSQWALIRVDGSAIAVQSKPGTLPAFDAERAAFAPSRISGFPEASFAGPPALPELTPWWNLAGHRSAGRSWEADAAPVFVRLFELQPGGVERSPALPLLAVRAARIGIAAHPRADDAWLALARAYLNLSRGTWEASAGSLLTPLRYLHHVQTVAALLQAATLNPDSIVAHELLAGAFGERRFLDLELLHRRVQLRLATRTTVPGESPADREDRLARLTDVIDQIERTVQESENRFLVHTNALAGNPLERARIARDLGLANTALDTLIKSHPDLYGVAGIRLMLELLLQTGRIEEARILLEREELRRNPEALEKLTLSGGVKDGRAWGYNLPAYHWFDFCRSAAAGQYEPADAALDRIRDRLVREEQFETARLRVVLGYRLATEAGQSFGAVFRMDAQLRREMVVEELRRSRFLRVVRADLHVLGGLLHLERGSPSAAEVQLTQALDLYGPVESIVPALPGQPLAVRYREAIRRNAK